MNKYLYPTYQTNEFIFIKNLYPKLYQLQDFSTIPSSQLALIGIPMPPGIAIID